MLWNKIVSCMSSFIKNLKLTGFIQLFFVSGSYESRSEVNKVLKDIFGMLFLFLLWITKYKYLKVVPLSKLVNKQFFDHTSMRTMFDTQFDYGRRLPNSSFSACVSEKLKWSFWYKLRNADGSLIKGMPGRHPIKSVYQFSDL